MQAAARDGRRTPTWATASAALLTVAVVVLLDTAGGADSSHTWWVATAALALAAFRVSGPGRRHRGIMAALSALVVAQPALHLVSDTWHDAVLGGGPGVEHGAWHAALSFGHVALAVAAVLLVALADILLLAAARTLSRVLRVCAALAPKPVTHAEPRRCTVTLGPVGELAFWAEYAVRRGPPVRVRVPA